MTDSLVSQQLVFREELYDALMHPGGRPAKHPRSNFGARIAQLREQAGLSQIDLAQKLGVSQQAVALWERKASTVRSDTLTKLAQALNVTADVLLGVNSPKSKPSPAKGRLSLLFDKASRLPRRQQEKIVEFVEAFVDKQVRTH
jgi:transcriptional regulator with XRE-family HTH domain